LTDTEADGARDAAPPIKIRIEALSDLVFGLALSIGSIILVGNIPTDGSALGVNVLIFGFGFAIIVLTWLGYSRTTSSLPAETPYALASNIVLLFTVALEPYLLYVLINAQTAGLADASSVAYGLDVGGMFLMQGVLSHLVLKANASGLYGGRLLNPITLSRYRWVFRADMIVGLTFAASALPIFWVDTPIGYVRFYLWSSSLLLLMPLANNRRPVGHWRSAAETKLPKTS
jgi:uncharacterized membrane protein